MEQEYILVKGKCNKMVTRAMSPSFGQQRQRKLDHFLFSLTTAVQTA